jgi:hypothetical protein
VISRSAKSFINLYYPDKYETILVKFGTVQGLMSSICLWLPIEYSEANNQI